ncbi:hypothetical protein HQ563_01135 [bacterium]|nr:hypothetical protein [bacterium]
MGLPSAHISTEGWIVQRYAPQPLLIGQFDHALSEGFAHLVVDAGVSVGGSMITI